MNFRDILMWESIIKTRTHRHTGHASFWQQAMSRRHFARSAAGTAVVGATLGSGLWKSGQAEPRGSSEPVPIPGGFQAGGRTFHAFAPGSGNPPDLEPSTITDFNGFVGLAYINGMVTQTNTKTDQTRRLPFLASDMRFMQGVFRDTEGRVQQGAFALVWVDVYDPSLGTPAVQIHDLNPGIKADGLFWTTPFPDEGIEVSLGKGVASMSATNVPIHDYGNFGNALLGGGPAPIRGLVSFSVEWSGVSQRVKVQNTNPTANGGGFAGEFIRNAAQMQWTATVGDLMFLSDPLATSSSTFAEIGHERNGSFFS